MFLWNDKTNSILPLFKHFDPMLTHWQKKNKTFNHVFVLWACGHKYFRDVKKAKN